MRHTTTTKKHHKTKSRELRERALHRRFLLGLLLILALVVLGEYYLTELLHKCAELVGAATVDWLLFGSIEG